MSISQKLHKILILLSALLILFTYAGVIFYVHFCTEVHEITPVFLVSEEAPPCPATGNN